MDQHFSANPSSAVAPLSRKTCLESLHYLGHVEMNLILAGIRAGHQEIASRFETLFPQLGFQAAKGRDARKFIYVQDVSGRREPFTLPKLECKNG
jgi:hypothetical protein